MVESGKYSMWDEGVLVVRDETRRFLEALNLTLLVDFGEQALSVPSRVLPIKHKIR